MISGVRLVGTPPEGSHFITVFRDGMGDVLPGVRRVACIEGEHLFILIRIRTADTQPDRELLGQLSGLFPSGMQYVASHWQASDAGINVFLDRGRGIYEIFMQRVPPDMLDDAKKQVGAAAAYFFQSKENSSQY
ncbi:TPA: hypothetical protein EYP38_04250 [Candidatus Micrarchaeota archaeon]|nr:hypothetical protein [Candidatus Micrarchaeota archaeon]